MLNSISTKCVHPPSFRVGAAFFVVLLFVCFVLMEIALYYMVSPLTKLHLIASALLFGLLASGIMVFISKKNPHILNSSIDPIPLKPSLFHAMGEPITPPPTEQEKAFRLFFKSMPQGVALYQAVRDASGTLLNFRLVDMNDTWIHLMGANPTEQPGLLLTDMEGFVEPTHLGIFRCVVTTGEPQIFRQYQPLTRRHFRVLVTSLHEGWIATTIDVAIAAEDPLPFPPRIQTPHAADSIGALAGGMAHTINNQLTAILGNAQFALQSLSPNSPAYPMLEEINNASLRVADLCNKLLRYAGKSPYQMETITVASLINEICPVLECSVPPTISIFFCVPNNLPDITADREELRQVLTGLVANAMEAIGDRVGKIIVAAGSTNCKRRYLHNAWLGDDAKEGEYVYLEVRDTGSGMSHETQKRIFDPFYSTKFMGRGLGLAATLGIVRAHHGVIKVHSQIGKGTSIRILFPKAESQNSHDRATAPLDQYAFYTSNAVADS